MISIQYQVKHIRHFTIKTHSGLNISHFFHTTHILTLSNHHRRCIFPQRLRHYAKLCFFDLRQLTLENSRESLLLTGIQYIVFLVFFNYQVINDITVYASKTYFFKFLLQHTYHSNVKLSIHQQYVIALILGRLNIAVLLIFIVGIQINQVTILVSLIVFYQSLILFKSIMFVISIGKKGKIFCSIIEILLSEHSIINKDFQIIPFLLKLFTIVLEYRLQAIGYFLCNVCRNFLHIRITLQIGTRNIQWNIRRIKYSMQQSQKVWNNALYGVRYIHLIAIELYFVFVQLYVALYFWKVQYTCKMERVIHIQMYPKQRFIGHRIKVTIELFIILVF